MERLQHELLKAAANDSVISLYQLLSYDPVLLDRVTLHYNSETALHVSALLGHHDFVKKIIGIKPELTNELNSQRSSALHLASANGHADVVRALLSVSHETCLAQDKDGLTPLHLAAVGGQVAVMKLLLRAKPEAARLTSYGGETILHLCVKNCQLEALKLLVSSVRDPEFVKCKDGEGNTLLHLAVEYKQVETIKLLVNNGAADKVDVNAVNHKGLTAMDVLIQSRSDVRDSAILESLNRGAGGAARASMADKRIDEYSPVEMIRKSESAIMIVASVVAAMTLQVAVNPPGGVWQDDNYLFDKDGNTVDPLGNRISYAVDSQNRTVRNPHRAGYSIMGTNHPDLVSHLFRFNTIAYYSSMSIILLMLTGLPSRYKFFAMLLILAAFLAIEMAVGTYEASVRAWMPSKEYGEFRMTYKIGTMAFLSCILLSVVYFSVIWVYHMWRSKAATRAKPNNFGV